MKDSFKFQFITHFNSEYDYLSSAEIALKGGCRWVQLRVKRDDGRIKSRGEFRDLALRIKELCREYEAYFIIDDDVELVKEVGADGVHLGKNDMPIAQAREILGEDFIIGGTANTVEDVRYHHAQGADYIGMGPFRFTQTKKNISPVLGIPGYEAAVKELREAGIQILIVAIGGILTEDIGEIIRTGVNGVAVSGLVINAEDPERECGRILERLNILG